MPHYGIFLEHVFMALCVMGRDHAITRACTNTTQTCLEYHEKVVAKLYSSFIYIIIIYISDGITILYASGRSSKGEILARDQRCRGIDEQWKLLLHECYNTGSISLVNFHIAFIFLFMIFILFN